MRENEKPWTEVHRNRRKSNRRKTGTTFYVANIPEWVTSIDLKEAFKHIGTLSDTYVARKKDAQGNFFGFVRLVDVFDLEVVLKEMNGIRLGAAKVGVSLARFDKNHRPFEHSKPRVEKKQWMLRTDAPRRSNVEQQVPMSNGGAYRDAVMGSLRPKSLGKSVVFEGKGLQYPNHCIGKSVWGVAKNLELLNRSKAMLYEAGAGDFSITYIGGLSVLVTFKSKYEAKEFIDGNKKEWSSCWSSATLWNGEELVTGRMACICFIGVPIQFRDGEYYDRLGELFGKVVGKSECSWTKEDVSDGRCIVVTQTMGRIEESVDVWVQDKLHKVSVLEEPIRWKPCFKDGDPSVSSKCGSMEVEEGEIREEEEVPADGNIPSPEGSCRKGEAEYRDGNGIPTGMTNVEDQSTLHGK